MNVTALTTACHRPEAWKICEGYMARQTVKPNQWLVLDDDEPKTVCSMGQEYHYWPELRGRGSLTNKIRRALERNLVKGDAIIFIENDDYFAPDYIEWCVSGLEKYALFGEGRALYYNVQSRFWFEHRNMRHASLCATALRRDMYPHLLKQCRLSQEPYVDEPMWMKCVLPHHVTDPYSAHVRRSVGIKAMPGRVGYGGGHKGRDRSAIDDLDLSKLRALIGADADNYAQFYDPKKAPLPPERNGHIAPSPNHAVPRPPNMKNIARSEAGRVHGPNWLTWIGHLAGQPNIIGVEIGTFEGDSAEWMLENIFTHETSRYHCIDPFTGSAEHKVGGFNTSKLEETTRAKLAKFRNVEIHKGYSQDVVRRLNFKADFFYIDGDHTTRAALRDGVFAFESLKVGGVACFDDYAWAVFPNELDRPKTGIDSFVKSYRAHLEVISPKGWQLVVKKTRE